ncbi:MAG: hypothetical protein COA54_03700 [Thiotrichaceae bacterium]|nr:MAG: hypothetical protein COA54_03700 [Thiotrichaceae bacterium]
MRKAMVLIMQRNWLFNGSAINDLLSGFKKGGEAPKTRKSLHYNQVIRILGLINRWDLFV